MAVEEWSSRVEEVELKIEGRVGKSRVGGRAGEKSGLGRQVG